MRIVKTSGYKDRVVRVFARSDYGVIGQDPELADMENPSGHIYGESFYIVAEMTDGSRWAADLGTRDQNSSDQKASEYQAKADKGWTPESDSSFHTIDPAYGSEAYEVEEPYIVERERQDDEDGFMFQVQDLAICVTIYIA